MTVRPTAATTAIARTAVDEELSTRRLNVMRFGYAFMGVGLAAHALHPPRARTGYRCRYLRKYRRHAELALVLFSVTMYQ